VNGVDRFGHLFETEKQRSFDRDFLSGWEKYDIWEEVEVGRSFPGRHEYVVKEEDLLYYNRAVGETDPLLVDPEYAAAHSPTGAVVAHPLFMVSMLFYCLGSEGPGTWIRTPGAMNPFQEIELHEPIYVGDRIRLTLKTVDRFVRRGRHYITNLNEFRTSDDVLKVVAWGTLIVPPTREDVRRFATA
jgi:acyl dehydratase